MEHGYFFTIRKGNWYKRYDYSTAEYTCQRYGFLNVGNGYTKRLYRIVNNKRKLLDTEEG
jgi:hypothetical protein